MNDTIPAPPPQTLTPGQEARTVLADTRRVKAELLDAISRCLDICDEDPDPRGGATTVVQDWLCARGLERVRDVLWVVYGKHGP
jgi:hypothetical protein